MRKLAVVALVVLLGSVGFGLYLYEGWSRMTYWCGEGADPLGDNPPVGNPNDGVRHSWQPIGGFTCTYSNGKQSTSYWFE